MTARVHIERLVVDEGVLGQRDLHRFQSAVSLELNRLRQSARGDQPDAAVDAVQTLARTTAAAIHDRMPRP